MANQHQGTCATAMAGPWGKRWQRAAVCAAALALFWAYWSDYKIGLVCGLPRYDPGNDVGFFYSESATHYRYCRMIGDPRVPWGRVWSTLRHDDRVQHPEGVAVLKEYPFGMQLFYGALHRRLAPSTQPHVFLLHAVSIYSGLSLLMVFLMARKLCGACGWALLAAGLYATITWSFVRLARGSFLYEDFALPFLLGAIALLLPGRGERRAPVAQGVAAGLAAGCAAAFWHVSQYPLALTAALLSLWAALRSERGGEWRFCAAVTGGFALAAVAFPVLRAKVFTLSLPMAVFIHWAVWARVRGPAKARWRLAVWGATLLALVVLLRALNPTSGDYSHVFEYVTARLRYPLGPPEDPTRISFAARMYWEGSFLGARAGEVFAGLRFALLLIPLAVAASMAKGAGSPQLRITSALALAMLVAGLGMRRFLGQAAPLVAVATVAGLAAGRARLVDVQQAGRRWLPFLLPAIGVGALACNIATLPRCAPVPRRPPPGVYESLVMWLKAHTDPDDAFFARMPSAAVIQTHTDRPSLSDPHFESRRAREKYEALLTAAFGDEEALWRRLRESGAKLFIYDVTLAFVSGPGSALYKAGQAGPLPADCAVARCQFAPESLRCMDLAWQNGFFRVYRLRERPASAGEDDRRRAIASIADNGYQPIFDARNFTRSGGAYVDIGRAARGVGHSVDLTAGGARMLMKGERERARALLLRAVYACPNNLDAHCRLVSMAREDGDVARAALHLREARRIAPLSRRVAALAAPDVEAPR